MKLVYQNEGQERKFVVTETNDRTIIDQFIDYETGYLIVRETNKDESDNLIYTTAIEPKSGKIIKPQERMKQLPTEEQVTIDQEKGLKITTLRTINEKTGSELIHEKLIEISTQKQISSSISSAFSSKPRETIMDSYHEDRRQQKKNQDFWNIEYPNKTFEEKQVFWVEYIYRSMRMRGEPGFDEYSIFNKESYEEWKQREPQIDIMLDHVIRTFPFDRTADEVREIVYRAIGRS
jgi:hypothetical protein